MVCGNCGTENEQGVKFCKQCGSPMEEVKESKVSNSSENIIEESKKKKTQSINIPKKGLLCIGAVAILIIVAVLISVNARPTIDLNKYVTVEVNGYNGYGRANVKIDWDAIEEKYGDRLVVTDQAEEQYGILMDLMTPTDVLNEFVDVDLDNNNQLTNGTVITYNWDVDSELSKYLKCKVKYKDDTFKVEGLEEVDTFDAFANLTVEFTGIAPNGSIEIDYSGSELDSYDFSYDVENSLSNGDSVMISIDDSTVEYCAENLGMVPKETEKEYTVEGLSSYIMSADDIDADVLEQMKQQADDVFNSHVASELDESETLEDFSYLGTYLLTSKGGNTFLNIQNQLYLVYRAKIKIDYVDGVGSFEKEQDVYWFLAYDNIIADQDGKVIVDITEYSEPYDTVMVESGVNAFAVWYYEGYATLDALYKEIVMGSADSFNCQDNVEKQ